MRTPFRPTVVDGVLLRANGDVHRQTTSLHTSCGEQLTHNRQPVTDAQARVYQLRMCMRCFPPPQYGRPQ